jgi:cytoskeletal protein CcmA (bactofilin family)
MRVRTCPHVQVPNYANANQIKREITGSEDLQIDGVVEGPISLDGHDLIVGSAAQFHSEIHAGEVVVCGKLVGNVLALNSSKIG